jgi:hypothetical protein
MNSAVWWKPWSHRKETLTESTDDYKKKRTSRLTRPLIFKNVVYLFEYRVLGDGHWFMGGGSD